MQKKTDNHNLKAKLDLRRKLLKKDESYRVLDCFSGESEAIWKSLKKEYIIEEHLALDIKRKKGRLSIDSLKVLQGQEWTHDVVDLDAYGSPWEHYFEALKSDRHEKMIVFLTIGTSMLGNLSKITLQALGVPDNTPIGMHRQLALKSVDYCIAKTHNFGYIIDEAYEAMNEGGNARYIGLSLIRTQTKI